MELNEWNEVMTDLFQALTLIKNYVELIDRSVEWENQWVFTDLHKKAEKMLEPRPLTLKRVYEIAQRDDDLDTIIDIECTYKRSQYE